MSKIIDKQYLLTGYLELLLNENLTNNNGKNQVSPAVIITPRDPSQRGCQLSLEFSFNLEKVHGELEKRGVVVRIIYIF